MENIDKIKRVVDFYTSYNRQLYDNSGYYGAMGHIYGNLILASVFQSEIISDFHEKREAFLYSRILFDHYDKVYSDNESKPYHIGNSYADNGSYSNPIDNLRTIEMVLSKIVKNDEEYDKDYLNQLGKTITSLYCGDSGEKVFDFYKMACLLRDIPVNEFESDNFNYATNCRLNFESRRETLADHTVSSLILALALKKEFSYVCDMDRLMSMIVFSNISNAILKDTVYKGLDEDLLTNIIYDCRTRLFGYLRNSNKIFEYLDEYDNCVTKEAKLAHLINEMCIDLQTKIYQDNRVIYDIKSDNPDNETRFDRIYKYRKAIYENKIDFPEFKDILKYIKLNNLCIPNIITKETKLSNDDLNTISSTIYKQLKSYYQDDTIECIYMYGEMDKEYQNEKIKVVIVKRDEGEYNNPSKYVSHFSRINESNKDFNKCNINVEFIPSFSFFYNIKSIRVIGYFEPLLNATILLDRTGIISKMQREIKSEFRYYNKNYNYNTFNHTQRFVLFEPPIEENIIKRLKSDNK